MNDRELLELAAKAAGLNYTWCEFWETMARPLKDGSGWNHRFVWNPMRDDAAAFRLAMQLQMTLELGHKGCIVKMWGWPEVSEMCHQDSSDNPECTRRAIVRAAAQIGEVLP